MSLVLDKSYEDALRFVSQGNFNQAIRCFKQSDPKGSNSEILSHIKKCQLSLARKLWRQNKTDEFSKIILELNSNGNMSLALARQRGTVALAAFADSNQSVIGLLATCSLQQDVKAGLIMLRKNPDMKCIAEGWIALIKGDFQKGLELFSQGCLTAPRQAEVGKGVAHLCMGNFLEAEKYLNCLKTYSENCFPVLYKSMAWDNLDELQLRKMSSIDFHMPLNELLALEKTIPTTQKLNLALLNLKIGDQLALRGNKKALIYWNQAEKLNSKFKIEVKKRIFQASIDDKCDFGIDSSAAFIQFYNHLKKHSESEATDFIHYLVFDSFSSIRMSISVEKLLIEYKPLKLDTCAPEIQLLWLSLLNEQVFSKLKKINIPDSKNRALLEMNWSGWLNFFTVLDPLYSSKESYLMCKLSLAQILKEHDALRQTAFSLLCLNPHLVDEMLPIYISAIIFTSENSIKELKKDKAKLENIREEVSLLTTFFPRNFDLMRILELSKTEKSITLINSSESQLSESLYAVLRLQYAIDRGDSLAKIKKIIPDSELLKLNKEAKWRLIAALSEKRIKYPKKALWELFNLFAPSAEEKHEFCVNMRKYAYTPTFYNINQWMKQDYSDWQPCYHLMHYHYIENDFKEYGRWLRRTEDEILKTAREYTEIMVNVQYVEEHYPHMLPEKINSAMLRKLWLNLMQNEEV